MPTLTVRSSHPFTPPKLSAYVDEAKTYAAEYTLQTLGIPTDGAAAPTAVATAASAAAFPGMTILGQAASGK